MKNSILKSFFTLALMAGLMFTSFAPATFAQGRYRDRYPTYNRNRDYDNQRNRDYRYDDYEYDRRNSTKDGLKRTGIGAAIGAAGGALMGGRKGAVIGGVIGAAGGYIYHRKKENDRRY